VFLNPARQPATVSFREPHPSDTLRQTALRNYIRKRGHCFGLDENQLKDV